MYARRPWRGLILVAANFVFLFAGGTFDVWSTYYGFLALSGGTSVLLLLVIVDSMVVVDKSKELPPRWYSRWYVYLVAAVVVLGSYQLVMTFRSVLLGFDVRMISSPAMAPTVHPYDFILVDTRSYNSTGPEPGDLILFRYPPQPEHVRFRRVIATEGQTVSMATDGTVQVDGVALVEPYLSRSMIWRPSMQSRTVQAGELFTLGDNRTLAGAGRFQGIVPRENVLGRATFVLISMDPMKWGLAFQP
jgi:signal peptidase I